MTGKSDSGIASHQIYTDEQRERRDSTIWTTVQGILAPLQFIIFGISLVLLVRYLQFGLGYEELAKERSDVIVGVISGYGNYGPYRNYLGYGPTTAPLSGLSSMTGYEGGPPQEVGISLGLSLIHI